MIAVDTNVVIRLLIEDDPEQARQARVLFTKNRVLLLHTVLLEAEWVMRRRFRFAGEEIASALVQLLGLPNVVCPRLEGVIGAIDGLRAGCDFADALHACLMPAETKAFVTFDRSFVTRARDIAGFPPVHLLGSAPFTGT